jgi:hypothetical protein
MLAVFLALAALVLFASRPGGDHACRLPLDNAIDSLLSAYGVQPQRVKKWVVRTPDGTPVRTERRVLLPPKVKSLDFNRDLSTVAAGYDAVVAGTERTKEMLVVLHVVTDGYTVQTISLVPESPK